MATYKEEHGTGIVKVTTDPTNPINGQVWYNSTSQTLKGFTSNPVGSWATGGVMGTLTTGSSAGTQTEALMFGGHQGPGSYNLTQYYNGNSWTTLTATLNSARSSAGGTGTYTSALMFGGYDNGGPLAPLGYLARTESYDGSSWTEVSDLNNARQILGSAGADNTSALAFGGLNPPGSYANYTETWNGSSWTEVNNLNTGRYSQGDGSITSALNVGGLASPTRLAIVESWNGTSWTEVGDLNTARTGAGVSADDNTSALAYGGSIPPSTDKTELWNGSSWSEQNDLLETGNGSSNIGNASAALSANKPGGSNEWNAPFTSTVTFTTT